MLLAVIFAAAVSQEAFAQEPTYSDYRDVFPQCSDFEPSPENSTIYLAKCGDRVMGFCFQTSDFAPIESRGYSGIINTLVGMDTTGMITGIKVISYSEAYEYADEFAYGGPFIDQFQGKYKGDSFRVGQDIDGITGATVSSSAIAKSVGQSAQRVYSIMAGRY